MVVWGWGRGGVMGGSDRACIGSTLTLDPAHGLGLGLDTRAWVSKGPAWCRTRGRVRGHGT